MSAGTMCSLSPLRGSCPLLNKVLAPIERGGIFGSQGTVKLRLRSFPGNIALRHGIVHRRYGNFKGGVNVPSLLALLGGGENARVSLSERERAVENELALNDRAAATSKLEGKPDEMLRKKKRKNVAQIREEAVREAFPKEELEEGVLMEEVKKKDKPKKKKKKKKKKTQAGKIEERGLKTQKVSGPSVKELLERGRKLLQEGDARTAAECFRNVCRREPKSGILMLGLLGLTEALWAQSNYDAALAVILEVLAAEPENAEALYWAGLICLYLERFQESREHLLSAKALCKKGPLAAKIEKAIADTQRCEKESQGIFDLERMHTEHEVPQPTADYLGPIEVTALPNKGRGLTVTRDVEEGELLLVTKAVAVSNQEGRPPGKEVDTNAQDEQVARAVYERVKVDPWVRAQVESMYDGTDRQLSLPTLDLFRRSATSEVSKNGALTLQGDSPANGNPVSTDLDLERIKRVKMYNAFSTETAQDLMGEEGQSEMDEVGLWTLAGYINHSCIPTASYFVMDNVHVVFAVRDLAKGSEITQPYMAIAEPLKKRQRDSRLNYKFACRCPRCLFEESLKAPLEGATDAWQEVRDRGGELLLKAEDGGSAAEEAFRFFWTRVETLEATIGKMDISEDQKNWLRASYLTCYTRLERASEMVQDWDTCLKVGLVCLDAVESVNLYYSFTIQHAAEIGELLLCRSGKESVEWHQYKKRMLRIVQRSLNCVPEYAKEAVEEIESFKKGVCFELFSEDICQW